MNLRVRNGLVMGVVFLSLIFIPGCGTLETLVNKDGSTSTLAQWIGGTDTDTTSVPVTTGSTTTSTTSTEQISIALYFPDSSGKYLMKEVRSVPKTVSLAKETINQWIKGPTSKDTMLNSVSTATTLLGISIKDNVATVDLSKEFLLSNSKVTSEVALYGLVNTLTQFTTIQEVAIRVDGKAITLYGTVNATHLVNKSSLIKDTTSNSSTTSTTTTNSTTGAGTSSELGNTGSENTDSDTSNEVLTDSPSSINLFTYPSTSI